MSLNKKIYIKAFKLYIQLINFKQIIKLRIFIVLK